MRKMKKINGYLVVMFNAKEHRDWDGNGLGNYGVIDAELYTGCLDVDRGVMEYDSAETLEEAVEQARGLNSEEDFSDEPPTVTVIVQSSEGESEDTVDPQMMIAGWTEELTQQVETQHYPEVNALTAAHQLYGFKVALSRLGLIDEGEAYVLPNTFGAVTAMPDDPYQRWSKAMERQSVPAFKDFLHHAPGVSTQAIFELGMALRKECPNNDCIIYRNVFNMAMALDDALDFNFDYAREVLARQLFKDQRELRTMYRDNYAVRTYREQLAVQKFGVPAEVTPHKPGDGGVLALPLRSNIPYPKHEDWKLVTCPVCGAECWESDLARQARAAEPELRVACTACALKAGLRKIEAEPPTDGATPRMGIDEVASKIYSMSRTFNKTE